MTITEPFPRETAAERPHRRQAGCPGCRQGKAISTTTLPPTAPSALTGMPTPPNLIAFGSAPRRQVDGQPIRPLDRRAVNQTETHILGFLSVANAAPSNGEAMCLRGSSGGMVMPLTAGFLVGSSNLGRLNTAPPPPPTTTSRPGCAPPTKKVASAALPFTRRLLDGIKLPHCLQPPKKMSASFSGQRPQNQKIHWGMVVLSKKMIYKRVEIQYHALGYATRMTPKRGGSTTPAPALDLTTSLSSDSSPSHLNRQHGFFALYNTHHILTCECTIASFAESAIALNPYPCRLYAARVRLRTNVLLHGLQPSNLLSVPGSPHLSKGKKSTTWALWFCLHSLPDYSLMFSATTLTKHCTRDAQLTLHYTRTHGLAFQHTLPCSTCTLSKNHWPCKHPPYNTSHPTSSQRPLRAGVISFLSAKPFF